MTCVSCPAPATTTVVSDYDGDDLPVCAPCRAFFEGADAFEGAEGGYLADGYEAPKGAFWCEWE